jgi:transposase
MALRVRELSADERHELERRARSRTEAVRVVERARLILAVAAGQTAPAAAVALGLVPDTGRQWVKRFNAAGLDGLADRPRSGRPVTYGPQVVGEVLATALTKPDTLGLPFACWTLDRLEAYLNEEQGIAIKRSRIDEVLVDEGLRWRTQETWFGERARAPRAGDGAASTPGGVSSGPPPGHPTQTEQERARLDPQFAQKRGPSSRSTPPHRRGVS